MQSSWIAPWARAIAVAASLVSGASAWADSWSFDPIRKEQRYTFGDSVIVLTVDATENQEYPLFLFQLYLKDKLQAQLSDVGFDAVFASDDNSLFVGLSNSGLPGTAVMIFSARGNIRLLVQHGIAAFDYCDFSVTLARRWHDGEVKIVPEGQYGGKKITLRDCHGKTVDLYETIVEAHARTKELLDAHRKK